MRKLILLPILALLISCGKNYNIEGHYSLLSKYNINNDAQNVPSMLGGEVKINASTLEVKNYNNSTPLVIGYHISKNEIYLDAENVNYNPIIIESSENGKLIIRFDDFINEYSKY